MNVLPQELKKALEEVNVSYKRHIVSKSAVSRRVKSSGIRLYLASRNNIAKEFMR